MDATVYYKLRITTDDDAFDPERGRPHHQTRKSIWNLLKEDGAIHGKGVAATEVKGKDGDYVRQHFHIHFASRKKKDAIRKKITRYWEAEHEEKLSGNKQWSFKLEPYVDTQKFFNYPLKQQKDSSLVDYVGFTKEEIETMMIEANAVCRVSQEVVAAKGARKEENDTLYDRLARYLDKTEGDIKVAIITFYMGENRPINNTTLIGYYHLYRLKTGVITPAEYADALKWD